MLNSAQICTNCAPIFFEFFQKNLETQAELRRTRDQVQRLSFTKELGSLKDASSIDLSISPQPKAKQNHQKNKESKSPLTLITGESALLDRPFSAVINTTMMKSYTPVDKYTRRSVIDFPLKKEGTNLMTNVSVITPTVTGSVSPIERLRDFENQVSKKVDSFKKKLQLEIAKSGQRPTSGKILSTRPKTTGKILETEVDQQHKSEPKVSMFSPEENRNPRASPIEFNLTPKLQGRERIDRESVPIKGEWTVGTRIHTDNTDRVLTPYSKHNIETSVKKTKDSFRNELEAIKMKNHQAVASSPTPADSNNLRSPFFSPLRASELMTPGGHHAHLRTEDSKKHYSTFIKPHSTPLLDSIMSSPKERIEHAAKSEVIAQNVMSFVGEKSHGKKGSYRSNYYQELFSDPLDQSPPSSKLVKTDKAIVFGSSKRGTNQDELQTIRDDAKNQNMHSFSISKNNRDRASRHLDDKLKTEGDVMDDIFEANYDRTRRKRVHDFTKPNKPSPVGHPQDEKWYLPVSVKGGKYYSMGENISEYKIGEAKILPIKNLNHEVTGGTLVYAKISEAQKVRFASLEDSDSDTKVVLEVEVQGSNIQINKNLSLYSTVTPIKTIYSDFDL